MARRTAIFYLIIASLWILLSDAALEWLAPTLTDVFYISKLKGIFFVGFTAMILYFFVKKEQDKKRKLEASYTELFQNNPNPMWLSRKKDGHIIAVNQSATELYGYPSDVFKKLLVSHLKAEIAPIHGINTAYHCHKNAAGEEIWVKYFVSHMPMAGEELDIHMVISADATMKAEAERHKTQTRINSLLNNMDDFVFGLDETGNFTVANPAFVAYINQGNLLGQAALPLLDGDSGRAWEELLETVDDEHRYFPEWYDPNRKAWLRINLFQTSVGMGGYASNISEHRELRHTVLTYEKTLKSIVNATEDMIWAFDAEFRLLTSNTSFDRANTIKHGQKLSKGDVIIPAEPDRIAAIQAWVDAYQAALKGETVNVVIHERDLKNKSIIFNLRCYPIVNEAGEVVCVGCFAHNITNRTVHEERIKKQNEQLLEIAWIQSHELRAPLANVLGLLELLKIDDSSEEQRNEYLHKLEAEAKDLDEIIHKVVSKSILPLN